MAARNRLQRDDLRQQRCVRRPSVGPAHRRSTPSAPPSKPPRSPDGTRKRPNHSASGTASIGINTSLRKNRDGGGRGSVETCRRVAGRRRSRAGRWRARERPEARSATSCQMRGSGMWQEIERQEPMTQAPDQGIADHGHDDGAERLLLRAKHNGPSTTTLKIFPSGTIAIMATEASARTDIAIEICRKPRAQHRSANGFAPLKDRGEGRSVDRTSG